MLCCGRSSHTGRVSGPETTVDSFIMCLHDSDRFNQVCILTGMYILRSTTLLCTWVHVNSAVRLNKLNKVDIKT